MGTISSKATLITHHQQTTFHDKERLVKETVQVKTYTNGTADVTIDMKCIAQWPLAQLRGINIISAFLDVKRKSPRMVVKSVKESYRTIQETNK